MKATDWEIMFTKYVSDQGFGSRIYRKLINKKTNNQKSLRKIS